MDKLKIQIVVILLSMMCGVITAQNRNEKSYHELRLGIGALPIIHENNSTFYNTIDWNTGAYSEYYQGDKTTTPGINLSYSYQFKSWFSLGATLSYAGMFQKTYNLYSDAVYTKRNWHFIGITPTARFDWFNRPTVKLYSCFGLGFGFNLEREQITSSGYTEKAKSHILTLDLVPIGITVGRTLFGFAEVGASTYGFVKIGIGYRFKP